MVLERKLNPPQIESKIPAFYGYSLDIPFNITRAVSPADFNKISVIIKTVQNNVEKLNCIVDTYYYDSLAQTYHALIDIENYNELNSDKMFVPQIGQYYKIQLALVNKVDESIGYYSSVGVVKYTSKPQVEIQNKNDNYRHRYTYTGVYSQKNGDTTEKVYSYCFNLYNEKNNLVATSGQLIHDNSKDQDFYQSVDTWTVRKNLDANVVYEIEYNVITVNGLSVSSGRYKVIESETTAPNIHANLSAVNSFDDGYITLTLVGDRSNALINGRFILMRSSSEDNFESWYELTKFDLSNWNSSTDKIICKDYTIQQGIKYLYAIRAYNSVGLFSNRMMNIEGPVVADFEDAFLYDGERQLKIRFNPKVSSFKSTILETKTDTIGGKYPFIFRNGNVEYKEFPISGLISLLGDENNEFLSGLVAGADEIIDELGHWMTTDNFRKERQFKMLVLSWLTNGKPKLFRSPAEGNFIIRLMNTSLSPNDTLGRMLHTFQSTAYEIAEFNFDNLKTYGFAMEDYVEMRTLKMGSYNNDPLYGSTGFLDGMGNSFIKFQNPAVYVSIVAKPKSIIEYTLEKNQSVQRIEIGLTGTYLFPTEVLLATPMINFRLVSGEWGIDGSVVFGYYDTSADNFSIIHDISINDQIIQIDGKGMSYNLITEDFEDIRKKTGAFHYLKIAPRSVQNIYRINGVDYWNNNYDKVYDLIPNILYFIYADFNEASKPIGYLDGTLDTPGSSTRQLKDLSYKFHMSGMAENQIVDFNGRFDTASATTGRYEALTNISSLTEIYAGNGLLLDLVYQEKELTYVVEVEGQYYVKAVASAKDNWKDKQNQYRVNPSKNNKTAMDLAYDSYIRQLNSALDNLQKEYDVEYAL